MLSLQQLQSKGEETFANDTRMEFEGLHSGNNYLEVRQYQTSHHLVRFYFITRVFSAYMETILNDFRTGLEKGLVPDVLIMNSCLWDLNKYHDSHPTEPPLQKALREYRQNLEKFFERLNAILPPSCLIIWNTAMPIKNPRGSFFAKEAPCNSKQEFTGKNIQHSDVSTPRDLIEANFYSASLACCYRFDVLDLHYSVRFLEDHHAKDGIHWSKYVHRWVTKLLLTHIADAWGVKLKKRRPRLAQKRMVKAYSRHLVTFTPSLPYANGFSPDNHLYFNQDVVIYDNGPVDDCKQWDPGHEDNYSNGSGVGDWSGYEPPPYHGTPNPGNDPRFQQNGDYDSGFMEGSAYENSPLSHPRWPSPGSGPGFQPNGSYNHRFMKGHGPPPYPRWSSPANVSNFQYDTSYDHGSMEGYSCEPGAPLHPGQYALRNDPSFQDDVSFHQGAEELEYNHGLQPHAGPWPYPENSPYAGQNGWQGRRSVEGYGAQQSPCCPIEEIHQNGFLPPSPGPINHQMAQGSLYSPYSSPQEARGGRQDRFVTYRQRQRNNLPYKRSQNGSRNPQQLAKPPWRPPYHS
ncbi:PC-esterase domain-containing protein 1A-like isoform X2 [Sceloporus undulatus]|nr:PC-esterase domain-containing protein 1A-like isoform X2 [Sceloporus undulatus]XP_042325787.1 PC-esterase domain-containing protein 1A-like isoform X2 [Sceloporus undulatus]